MHDLLLLCYLFFPVSGNDTVLEAKGRFVRQLPLPGEIQGLLLYFLIEKDLEIDKVHELILGIRGLPSCLGPGMFKANRITVYRRYHISIFYDCNRKVRDKHYPFPEPELLDPGGKP